MQTQNQSARSRGMQVVASSSLSTLRAQITTLELTVLGRKDHCMTDLQLNLIELGHIRKYVF